MKSDLRRRILDHISEVLLEGMGSKVAAIRALRPAETLPDIKTVYVNEEDYDKVFVGWKIREVAPADSKLSPYERRKIYDTTRPGRGNAGHTYGDDLTDAERKAILEYLKTL